MSDEMERNLGLLPVIAIAMGSMIGSGIFVLPGIAFLEIGTPAVVLAFLIGGIMTIPTALSAAEMSTAIPESGGSYLYIQRGMGPLLGTIAGIGNWLVLNFKTALALVGGIPYLIYILPSARNVELLGLEPIIVISIVLTIFFTALNAISAESVGRVQNVIVGLMLVALFMVLAGSAPELADSNPADVFDISNGGLLVTTSLVFISYAGVIRVSSVAEEIKNPGKNIPRGIIISLFITTLIYVVITYVTVFTVDIEMLVSEVPLAEGGLNSEGEGAIIAIVAQETIGRIGAIIVVVAALLALASTANSGILSASRYPFSMARDKLAPNLLMKMRSDSKIPIYSVLATGAVVILLVLFFPVDEVARLGGAFQVIVFMLVNIALIGFREGSVDYYNPEYIAPLYPYLQIGGILSGVVILINIGIVALAGSLLIVVLSVVYYYAYVSGRVEEEGEVKEEIRSDIQQEIVSETEDMISGSEKYRVMVSLRGRYSEGKKETMIEIAECISSLGKNVEIEVVEFDSGIKTKLAESRPEIESLDSGEYDNIEFTRVESDNIRESVVNYATYNGFDLMVEEYFSSDSRFSSTEADLRWIMENAPCETVTINQEDVFPVDKVTIASDDLYHQPVKIFIADAICNAYDAEVEFLNVIPESAPESVYESTEEYQDDVREVMETSDFTSWIVRSDEGFGSLELNFSDTDLIVSELDISTVRKRISTDRMMRMVKDSRKPAIFAYSEYDLDYNTIGRRILMKYIFRGFK